VQEKELRAGLKRVLRGCTMDDVHDGHRAEQRRRLGELGGARDIRLMTKRGGMLGKAVEVVSTGACSE
jgi:hypothetical protein